MRIGIIGAGVAGQAAAIALARAGRDVAVFERFETARPLGAGLLLQPSGLAALARLDLRGEAERCGARVSALDGRIVGGKRILDLSYPPGEYGLGIHRGALFQILHEAMRTSGARLHLAFEVASIEDFAHPCVVSRAGGREGPFDLLLDCAGAHDRLRDGLNADVRAPLYPWGALWTTCPDRGGEFAGQLRQRYDRAQTMIGMLPVGNVPGDLGGVSHVAFFWSLKLKEFDAQRAAGLDALKARVLAAWPKAEPIMRQISHFEDLSLATYRDVSMKRWRRGRVLAIGDAAHGTSPQLGQGANLALIDAIVLAHCLDRAADIEAALARFEIVRRPHVDFYRLASRALTPAFQSDSRLVPWLRDRFLPCAKFVPGGRHLARTTLSGVRKLPWGLWRAPD